MRSIALTSRIPVGKPKPISNPDGTIAISDTKMRINKLYPSSTSTKTGNQTVSSHTNTDSKTDQPINRPGVSSLTRSEIKLPMPVERMMLNNPMASP